MNLYHQPKPRLVYLRILPLASFALLLLALLLAACTFSVTTQIDGVVQATDAATDPTIPVGEFVTQSVGVAFVRTLGLFSVETYAIAELTVTKQLTNSQALTALSQAYTGTVTLDAALLRHPAAGSSNAWTLIYNQERVALSNLSRWHEYLQLELLSATPATPITGTTQILFGPQFIITSTESLSTVVSGAAPTDLATWVDAVMASQNTTYTSIGRLLFSVENNGKQHRVLFVADLDARGGDPLDPDGNVICGPNNSGRIYCRIIDWLTGG